MRRVLAAALSIALAACSVGEQLVAADGDLADYRAFRVAAHEGERLARARIYLDAHPDGAWAEEVRAAFDAEEPAYYERAKASRDRAHEYLVFLPRGPHADAARALIESFDRTAQQIELERLVAGMRQRAAMREQARRKRARLRALVLDDLALLLDARDYGVAPAEMPLALRRALSGPADPTLGWVPTRRDETVFFDLPTREGSEARAVTVTLEVKVENGHTSAAAVSGEGLFVAWAEADLARALDPTDAKDRATAGSYVAGLLAGALEPRMPAGRCAAPPPPGALVLRRCDGWLAIATMGARAGARDLVVVRGPAEERASGMRSSP